jgi:APA family basic amino acid/polyamine antiporter
LQTTSITPAVDVHRRGRLLQVLGLGFGLSVIIGNTIGSGIFRAPGEVAKFLSAPGWYLGVWVIGGLYGLLGTISLAELGTMLPRSGGQYNFVRHALGDYAGFVAGWSDWISTCGTTAAVSLVIGGQLAGLFPKLAPYAPHVAAAVAIALALLQWQGIVLGRDVQNVTSLLKTLAFLALIVAAFALGGGGTFAPHAATRATTNAITPTAPAGFAALAVAIVLSLQSVIYTYDGWAGVLYFSEEVKDPARDIPRSMFAGVLAVIAIYMLVNVALLYVLPIDQIAGNKFAAGAAAQVLFGVHGDAALRVLTIVSMLSAVNANHLMATRVLFAMSRDGLLSTRFAEVNPGGTPTRALLLSAAIAVLFIVFGQTFERVIAVLAFFFMAQYTLSFTSIFVLRRREPARPRPYRAWGYPWTTGVSLVASVVFLAGAMWSDTQNSLYALVFLAASYPVFRVTKWLIKVSAR